MSKRTVELKSLKGSKSTKTTPITPRTASEIAVKSDVDDGTTVTSTPSSGADSYSSGVVGTVSTVEKRVEEGTTASSPSDESEFKLSKEDKLGLHSRSVLGNVIVATKYVWSSTMKEKRSCLIGLFTVILVVMFICLLQNVIQRSPIVFLKLAENSVGEADITLIAKSMGNKSSFFVNSTEVTRLLNHVCDLFHPLTERHSIERWRSSSQMYIKTKTGSVRGCAPRWISFAKLASLKVNLNSSAILMSLDSKREQEIGIGREWKFPPLPDGTAYVSDALLYRIKGAVGDTLNLTVDPTQMLNMIGYDSLSELFLTLWNATGLPPLAQSFAVKIPLPFKLNIRFLNLTTGEISIILPDVTKDDVKVAYEAFSVLVEALGESIPAFNQTVFQLLPDGVNLGGWEISFNISDILPKNLVITPQGELQYIVSYDLLQYVNNTLGAVMSALFVAKNVTVISGISNPNGKYSTALGNVILLESSWVQKIIDEKFQLALVPLHQVQKNLTVQLKIIVARLNGIISRVSRIVPIPFIANATQLINTAISFVENYNISNYTIALNDYAMSVIVQKRDREEMYMKSQDGLLQSMIAFSNDISLAIGTNYPVSFSMSIYEALSAYMYFRLFLDQIFNFTVVVMLFLSGMLVYSLLLSDVESKTYEYGMLRALGLPNIVLIELLVIQTLLFAVPGIILGVLLGWIVYLPISAYISWFVALPLDLNLNDTALILCILSGVLMPAIANIVPIQRALSNTLRDALDIYHSVTSEVSVTIQKLETIGISPLLFALSVVIIALGFLSYYLIPYAFTYQNWSLFFTILIIMLIGFLFGLSIIAQTIEPWIQIGLLWLISWCSPGREALRNLVRKNFAAHSRRNSKTSIMLTTTFGFIVFAGAVFALLAGLLSEFSLLSAASDVTAYASTLAVPLPDAKLREFLNAEMASGTSIVTGYSFVTFAIQDYSFAKWSKISNLASYPSFEVEIQGIERNYLSSTFDRFFETSDTYSGFSYSKTPSGQRDVVASLYSNAGNQTLSFEVGGIKVPPNVYNSYKKQASTPAYTPTVEAYTKYYDALIATGLSPAAGASTNAALRLVGKFGMQNSSDTGSMPFLAKARALVSRMEGFTFSGYQSLVSLAPVLLPVPQYWTLLKRIHNSSGSTYSLSSTPDMARLVIRVRDSANEGQRAALVDSLHTYITDDTIQIVEVKGLVNSLTAALDILDVFFLTVASIAGCLCFFVLWLSFAANVSENAWEFAVLRSIGVSANRIIFHFVVEAVCLVISTVILGSIIGFVVAVVMTLEFNMFTNLPFTFYFPYTLFFPVIGMSFIIAVAGSYIPATVIKRKPIGNVLKAAD